MESPPKTISKPPRAVSLHPQEFAADEGDSGVFQLSDQSVMLLLSPSPEVTELMQALEAEGFSVVPVSDAATA